MNTGKIAIRKSYFFGQSIHLPNVSIDIVSLTKLQSFTQLLDLKRFPFFLQKVSS